MLKNVFWILGWFLMLIAGPNILIKLFGADQTIKAFFGSSRNLDIDLLAISIALIFLGIGGILGRLEKLNGRLEELNKHLGQDPK